jgi:nucleoside-diphosphate-sugar epimerase
MRIIPAAAQTCEPSADSLLLRRLVERVQQIESVYLRTFAVRQVIKGLLDFGSGLVAVAVALALEAGTPYGLPGTVALGAAVGALLVACHMLAGSYRSIWRYASLHDAIVVTASSGVVFVVLLLARSLAFLSLSGSTILLIPLLILFAGTGVRALRRWRIPDAARPVTVSPTPFGQAAPRRLLIAGAGEHGLSIGREIMRTAPRGVELVGFLDDDPSKIGAALHGVPVVGPLADALPIAERYEIGEVIVAMPSAEQDLVRTFVRQVEAAGIRVRAVRGLERFVRGGDVHRPGTATLAELLEGTDLKARPHGRSGPRRVLVTGGAGYIGSHLCRLLLERGYRVRILDRFDYGRAGIDEIAGHPHLEVLEGDICNSRDVSRAVRHVDGVLALAAIVGDPACNLDAEETIDLNYTATKILIEACNFSSVRRLVFASSCSVYGAGNHHILTERSRLSPVSLYARTRLLSERILFDRHGDVDVVVLRLATVFGMSPRMRFDLVVNTLTAGAVMDNKIEIFGGNQWRPFVHCRDAARAFLLALEAPAAAVAGEVFNVGGDALNHRIDELGGIVAECVDGVEVALKNDNTDPRDYRVSFAKIRRALGFEPEMTVARGIREVAAAMRRDSALQRYQDPVFHNVRALKRRFTAPPPARRSDAFAPTPKVGIA